MAVFNFHLFVLATLLILGTASARRLAFFEVRQSQDETRTRGTCTQMSNKCHLASRDDQVCPADYNRCPFDGAPCVLIEPRGDSSRKPEVRCGYLGAQGA
ncbi:hypothetical protein CGCTS75_v012508 [Colletotrichum tropicale]|nr:hypothetical protein CGCTS75_v012508 [Colletotrichum tropicale]